MSVVLALLTAVVLIAIGVLRSRSARKAAMPVLVRRYVHPGHTWLRLTEDGDVLVGVDDFTQSLVGSVEKVKLPRLLRLVKQGEPALEIVHGARRVPLVSPVSGWVTQKNEMVLRNPGLINSSPYGDGWLFRVRPNKLAPQLKNLFTGRQVQIWQDMVRAQLHRMFSGSPVLLFQDGGLLVKNLSDRCSDEEWEVLQKEFFLVDDESRN